MSKLKFGIATVSAIAAFVGIAGLSLPQARAGSHMETSLASDLGMSQQSWLTERAKIAYAIEKQECDTLKNSQPKAYEPCLEKARSTRDNLLTQTEGSEHAGQGSQGFASNQSKRQFSGQKEGPIEKMTSAVKEKLADWGIGSSDQEREGQSSGGQSQQGGVTQGQNPLQQGFDARQGKQGQDFAQQSFAAGGGQGGQNFGQQGPTGGQQFQGQQGQSDQGSFQGGNFGQQSQSQPCQQGMGGTTQQYQSGGTQGQQGSNDQVGSASGSAGARGEHMDRVEYYQVLADQQYATLNQECNTLKQDPGVYEQCRKHAESVRDKIAGMAEQGADATQRSDRQGG